MIEAQARQGRKDRKYRNFGFYLSRPWIGGWRFEEVDESKSPEMLESGSVSYAWGGDVGDAATAAGELISLASGWWTQVGLTGWGEKMTAAELDEKMTQFYQGLKEGYPLVPCLPDGSPDS